MNYLVAVAFCWFAIRRLLSYLHIFQQEDYDNVRFLRWMGRNFACDRRVTVGLLLVVAVTAWLRPPAVAAIALACAIFVLAAFLEADPRKAAKKRLVMTERATRIFSVALGFALGVVLTIVVPGTPLWTWILATQFLPFALMLAQVVLRPHEAKVQNHFLEEARAKLAALHPTVVGITGSYGKTSVKNILGHVLEAQASTLITQRNFNTLMGVTRVIREDLGRHHRFFVCEMGAYRLGSIARVCELVHPDLAIITAIGFAHYERFKTLDTVAHAKFELAEAVARKGGKIVLAEQVLELAYPAEFVAQHRDQCEIVGKGPNCSLRLMELRQLPEGIEVQIVWRNAPYVLHAPLYGEHSAINIAIAFAAACVLGMEPGDAVLALGSVPQTSHRLEVKREPQGSVLIDDAYNSNPLGFANGLQLLDLFRHNGGRRILVTPGMVELGTAHDAEHAKIGTLAAEHVDVLLPVVPERIRTLVEAYSQHNQRGVVVPCATFSEARSWLDANVSNHDVVLLENDLPDVYEAKLKL